jgi:hypothetical protein
MTRLWLNRALSSVRAVLDLIRNGDRTGDDGLVGSHATTASAGTRVRVLLHYQQAEDLA